MTENLGYYLDKYNTWSSYTPEDKGILIAYNSIHGNTEKAVERLAKILKENTDEKIVVSDLARSDMAEVIEDAFRYDKMIIATPTYDAGLFPTTEKFLRHLKHKNFQNRRVGIVENGSWAPMAGKFVKELLGEMKNLEIVEPTVTIKTRMTLSNEKELEELVKNLLK